MRQIDLTCLIASPIMAGLLLHYGGLRAAILGIMAWNVAAWLPECWLLSYAQRCSPMLRWEGLQRQGLQPPTASMPSI
jgi:iron-regulated transporter 1